MYPTVVLYPNVLWIYMTVNYFSLSILFLKRMDTRMHVCATFSKIWAKFDLLNAELSKLVLFLIFCTDWQPFTVHWIQLHFQTVITVLYCHLDLLTVHYFTVTLYILNYNVLWIHWQFNILLPYCTVCTLLTSESIDSKLHYCHTLLPLFSQSVQHFTVTLYILYNTVI